MSENGNNGSNNDLAAKRTDWAEDRTLMANERTFAGWMRTGMAAVGIGIGFNALFAKWEPVWMPKATATLFILIGIFIFYAAQKRACNVYDRLQSHSHHPLGGVNFRIVAISLTIGAAALAAGMWILR